ncbi:MAG TPA: SDR family oxidoreductase [Candidatus Dormibacteraeota bacterium]|nr:SDR family oxidoreductase [Candidatus Dormibacteraeota bacterium]
MIEEPSPPAGALTGSVVVVVGGASGIGRTMAQALARQGARVVIADFDSARMERTLAELLRLGTADAALSLQTDVRSDASVRALVRDAIKAMGRVDVVVNVAGVLLQGRLDRISSRDWEWMLETNLLGPVRTTNAFLPHMLERGSGHIVNAVGAGGLVPGDPLTIPYDCGHAALVAFTRSVAAQLRGTGVHVSLYCTGIKGQRIGQNTRSRGLGRMLHPAEGLEERPAGAGAADSLLDALHHPRFLVLADPGEAESLRLRWDELTGMERMPAS